MTKRSQMAKEEVIKEIVQEIDRELTAHPEARKSLKRIGRFALTRFELVVPWWAHDWQRDFSDDADEEQEEVTEGLDDVDPNAKRLTSKSPQDHLNNILHIGLRIDALVNLLKEEVQSYRLLLDETKPKS